MTENACSGSGSGSDSNPSNTATTIATTTATETTTITTTTTTTAAATTTTETTTTTTTAAATTTTVTATTTTTTSSPSTTPGSNSCSDIASWSDSVIYVKGDEVVYDSKIWVAAWWTRGDKPDGNTGVWSPIGSCESKSPVQSAGTHFKNSPGAELPIVDSQTCEEAKPWRPNTAYTSGSKVLYHGVVYVASWRNANQEPTESNALVWKKDPACTIHHLRKRALFGFRSRACQRSWSSAIVYEENSLAAHDDWLYRAQKRTSGEEPGLNSL
ncbi:hypothetical protein DFQ28_000619 [Apophysomyces sp. BC1034]|nr:hypothetical protein DFQ28_000619 [Apophysomyces sp. BC1034]